eukprot:6125915-Amphidinium_carterae.1
MDSLQQCCQVLSEWQVAGYDASGKNAGPNLYMVDDNGDRFKVVGGAIEQFNEPKWAGWTLVWGNSKLCPHFAVWLVC